MIRGRPGRDDVILAVVALVLGAGGAVAFAAWRALSRDAGRWSAFGEAMIFPGLLIIAAVAVMVWLGWKANID